MQRAVRLDDAEAHRTAERMARLETENQTLRQLLEICTTASVPIAPPPPPPALSLSLTSQADTDPDQTGNSSMEDSVCSVISAIEVSPPGAGDSDDAGEEKKGNKEEKKEEIKAEKSESVSVKKEKSPTKSEDKSKAKTGAKDFKKGGKAKGGKKT